MKFRRNHTHDKKAFVTYSFAGIESATKERLDFFD
jgi:hypothetical protein